MVMKHALRWSLTLDNHLLEDNVVEGPGFNVFAVKDDESSTPDRGFLSSTAGGIIPVTTVDGEPVGSGSLVP